jgi:hypothetical protein
VPGTRQRTCVSRSLKLALNDKEHAGIDHNREPAHDGNHGDCGERDCLAALAMRECSTHQNSAPS